MAHLCIRVLPNQGVTPELNRLRTQEGDAVAIQEDGHAWSKSELTCGQYRFLEIIDATQKDLDYLVESELDADEQMVGRRLLTLNMATLQSGGWANRKSATQAQLDTLVIPRVYP